MLADRSITRAVPGASPTPGEAPPSHSGRRDAAVIALLRRRIDAIERPVFATARDGALKIGAAAIDDALPGGGLALGALHEVVEEHVGAGAGFAAGVLARLATAAAARRGGQVLWCCGARSLYETGNLYAPGLAAFGLDPTRLIIVRGQRDSDVLWAMEEGLRCRSLVAVLGEAREVDLVAGRRLQLAAEASGVTGFVLRPPGAALGPTAALTRWRVSAEPSAGASMPGAPLAARWRVELARCRGGAGHAWLVEWHHGKGDNAGGFAVAAELHDGSVESQSPPPRLAAVGAH